MTIRTWNIHVILFWSWKLSQVYTPFDRVGWKIQLCWRLSLSCHSGFAAIPSSVPKATQNALQNPSPMSCAAREIRVWRWGWKFLFRARLALAFSMYTLSSGQNYCTYCWKYQEHVFGAPIQSNETQNYVQWFNRTEKNLFDKCPQQNLQEKRQPKKLEDSKLLGASRARGTFLQEFLTSPKMVKLPWGYCDGPWYALAIWYEPHLSLGKGIETILQISNLPF